ncbi:DNA-protecting protein DprA [Patescibacteria group bacterium]|nr:DNA-protecting protein DprA [Patescibacteria group bacterium]
MDNKDNKYWIAFSRIEGIGPRKLKYIYNYFSDMQSAWEADSYELKKTGLGLNDIEKIITGRTTIKPALELEKSLQHDINTITIKDESYPSLLKEIYDPPPLLYIKGSVPSDEDVTLAVVGTRKTTQYGRQITPELVSQFSQAGLTIISGLALGIDALAHQSAIKSGGKTIAVLACGLDIIYPVTNDYIGKSIINTGGSLISEYPPGTLPLKQHFPVRNRIISGLSQGVVIIEGNEDSGSLITARCALEQNRDVFAVPGNITSVTSRGPHKLLKLGAKLITSANDVLIELNIDQIKKISQNKKIIHQSKEEKKLLSILSSDPLHIDELTQKSKLNISIINSTLTKMEMRGLVRNLGGMYYILTR